MKRGEIVYVNLPLNPGFRIQGGRRPAILVIANDAVQNNPLAMIIPLTTKLAAERFPFTLRIEPTRQNGLSETSIALVFQLCAADRTHIDAATGNLEAHYIEKIDEMIRRLLSL